jgi:hypothetical protein
MDGSMASLFLQYLSEDPDIYWVVYRAAETQVETKSNKEFLIDLLKGSEAHTIKDC